MTKIHYGQAQDRMSLLPNYYRWTFSLFSRLVRGSIVDLGCGAGHLIPFYLDCADKVYAVDNSPELLARATKRFNFKVVGQVIPVCQDLNVAWEQLSNIHADVVLSLDVLEHFENDTEFARRIYGVLKPGGVAVIKVPAQSKLFCEIDSASGHFRRYDSEDLKQVMRAAGFDLESMGYMNKLGAWAYRMKGKKSKSEKSVRVGESRSFSGSFNPLTLRLINAGIPILALVDKYVPGKGLSLVGVFRKSVHPLKQNSSSKTESPELI